MMMRVSILWLVSTCWLWNTVASFSIVSITLTTSTTSALHATTNTRRSFLDAIVGTVATSAVVAAAIPTPVFAAGELGDLAMPTEQETKNAEAAAMAEKLRRKAELQKKAAQPRTFTESFQGEMEKQQGYKKQSQSERRDSMCETLGRGC